MSDFVTAFALVFVAELGDKSMLLALTFATRYRVVPVVAGVVTAAFVSTGLATAIGMSLGTALPEQAVTIGSGLLFLAFGVWMLLSASRKESEAASLPGVARGAGSFGVYLAVTAAFLLAELGDKTTLATAVLATTQAPVPTWIGAALGMSVTAIIAIIVGATIQSYVSLRWISYLSAAVFIGFGAVLLLEGWCGIRAGCAPTLLWR